MSAPRIDLPKGGGAIRGIGEKFAANAATGTASMSVPLVTSSGRSGFGPQLTLSYDSGAGNGPFGFGWSLSLPSITRKTDKGLPRYLDAEDSDVFILSGAEDLVPVYRQDADGSWIAGHSGYRRDPAGFWVRDSDGRLVVHQDDIDGYRVRRYRPRIEGLFARIERWSRIDSPADVHWRSISKDNILTLYGQDANSRIADPLDATRIFTWLICETRDDRGNAILYRYQAEDGLGVDPGQAHESNRGPANDARRTANRYLKRIYYGNRLPLLDASGHRPRFVDKAAIENQINDAGWMFEVVFDYGDHDEDDPRPQDDQARDAAGRRRYPWRRRPDPFSSYRSGFEIRTTRACRRVLMFHHFPAEAGVGRDCLVRSTDLIYSDALDPADARHPIYTFLRAVTQTGYRRSGGGYDRRSLPPVQLEYSEPIVRDDVEEVDPLSLENLPVGLDGSGYRWVDLHGEGLPGIFTEQAGGWFYKRNLSPMPVAQPGGRPQVQATFAPLEVVAAKPNATLGRGAEVMDLAGDGQPDVVLMQGLTQGLYEHDDAEGWQPFRPFLSRLNRMLPDPNVRFVDLDGDGYVDVLITEADAFVWHASLAEDGFGPSQRLVQALDEEKGPRVVFADRTESIQLADLSGDGLTDIVRIRNGEVCYWPNLGYGRFGAKVTMDNAPWFDDPDQFDLERIRLADIDGSGTTDILYLHRDGVRLYFNQCGNAWSQPHPLKVFPRVDDLVRIAPVDLLGNGTACLVWSSPLPGETRAPMRYVNLMGGGKPHLLVRAVNNLGAETRVEYASSTKHYLQDRRDGRPWISRLPFPVHVVERVQVYDHVSRSRFTTRYAYHHGSFDGHEREFRGFGMVEQWDTEELAALAGSTDLPADNLDAASHVAPIRTRTWFHTGGHLDGDTVSRQFEHEYFREPTLSPEAARSLLLDDTMLPPGLTVEEEREACRALKGTMLRQEVYADDRAPGGSAAQRERARTPYTVSEQNYAIRVLQPRGAHRHAVFFTHAREAISYHYERDPADPRVQHALTLEVDDYGNVLEQVAVAYGRRRPDTSLPTNDDRDKQALVHVAHTQNAVTNAIADRTDHYRTPLPAESRTFELRKPRQERASGGVTRRYRLDDLRRAAAQAADGAHDVLYEDVGFARARQAAAGDPAEADRCFRRLVEHVRTLYRPDDLGAASSDPLALLALGRLEPLALTGESYKLAFTPGLLAQVFTRPHAGQPDEPLLPDPAAVLGGTRGDQGGYVDLDGNGHWWIPSGRTFFSTNAADASPAERLEATRHFFLPRRYRDAFGQDGFIDFDAPHDLLPVETRDALGNRVTVVANDYRVLQPRLVSDPNRNRTEIAFDILGFVVGTAVMGKALPAAAEGDSLTGFVPDLSPAQIDSIVAQPRRPRAGGSEAEATPIMHHLLAGATTRVVYDFTRYMRLAEPAFAATIARETHISDLPPGRQSKLQISFSYSDGFGREIQKKIQAEPGPLVAGGPAVSPRWVGSGWTIFNNKGKPVRQYEPFFSGTHRFELGLMVGVSPVLFYDPAERVVATLHPNGTYEKVVFGPWHQTTYDVNDTCAARNSQTGDPRTDPDIAGHVAAYFGAQPAGWRTWRAQRVGPREQAAATRAAAHADTPTTEHFDALGRPYLTVARNRVVCGGHALDGTAEAVHTRIELDIEGNAREVRDERRLPSNHLPTGALQQRAVMRFAYDMLGNRIRQESMEAGARWMLADVGGKSIRAWDSRGHLFTTTYDALRRPVAQTVRGTTPESDRRTLNRNVLVDRIEYGEPATPGAEARAQRLNVRTRIYRHFDSAGIVTNARLDPAGDPIEAYDFKGNLLFSIRRLASLYRDIPDWSQNPQPPVDQERFEGGTRYDALNRPTQLLAPRSNVVRPGRPNTFNIVQPVFNEANLLERVHVWLERAAAPAALIDPGQQAPSAVGVANIDYNAKGQRLRIDYASGASTTYEYDPLTFRLTRLRTRRPPTAFPGDNPTSPLAGWPGRLVQNLSYTYDPAGNITHIQDDAQQAVYFRNRRVEPSNDYTYDAFYRLIQATGREHLGQLGAPIPHSYNDDGRVGVVSATPTGRFAPNNGNAMGTYTERYVYDAVGNFLQMEHERTDASVTSWTRLYDYDEASLTEPGKVGNRLIRTSVGASPPETYGHDAHGNMLRMPQLQAMDWDYRDRLRMTQRQKVNDEDGEGVSQHGERTYYVYDAAGQRVRKVTELRGGGVKDERIYLRVFEIFRAHGGAVGPVGASTTTLERETLHVMDDKRRLALVETRSLDQAGVDRARRQLVRYQLGNHLGSATLELDDEAQIISYEEYAPYGSSTYQAVRSRTDTAKRYRYTGRERDEESGLYYHGSRYYAPWLGRWIHCDPSTIDDGPNVYAYVRGNPCSQVDLTGRNAQPAQLHLVEQSELRQPVIATAAGRGYGQGLRRVFQALGNQWMLGPVDVGDPEDLPFALTPAGTMRGLRVQSRAENQLLGATDVKAEVAAARAAGQFVREKGVDPAAVKGTVYGQPALVPKLQGVRVNDPLPAAAPQTPPSQTPAPPQPSPPAATPPKQLEVSFDKPPPVAQAPASPKAPSAATPGPAPPAVAPSSPQPGGPKAAPSAPPASGGPNSGSSQKSGGGGASGALATVVPGAGEGLLAAESTKLLAARLGLGRVFSVASTAARAPGPAAAGALVGSEVGVRVERLAAEAGLSSGEATGAGLLSAMGSGALVGAGVGALAGGVGAGPGALAGALAGGTAYMMRKFL